MNRLPAASAFSISTRASACTFRGVHLSGKPARREPGAGGAFGTRGATGSTFTGVTTSTGTSTFTRRAAAPLPVVTLHLPC